MISALQNKLGKEQLLSLYAIAVVLSILIGVATEMYFLAGIPFGLLL